ncbi:YfhO family protein [candidate division WOR-3 bacterium]|nr:YfhO family protein [candidate division WOR-3 bacterium]
MGSKKKKHKQKQPQKEKKASSISEARLATPRFIDAHWDKIIIILLLVIPLVYFAGFLNQNTMIAGSDYLLGGLPFEKWIAEQDAMPLWYPHIFGGIPVLGSPQGGPLAPLAQLKEIMPPHIVLVLTFVLVFFLAGLGMCLYLKALGVSRFTAAIGAVMFQFIGNLATTPYAGHAGRALSIGMLPFMMYFVHRSLETRKPLYFLLLALATVFTFYDGHFQITYYSLLFILAYVIYHVITHRKDLVKRDYFKIVGYGLGAVACICLLMAAVWLPVLSGLSTGARGVERGFEVAASWAMPPQEIIDLVIPTYSGILDKYWGFSSFKLHMEYFGIIAVVFGLLAIILLWKQRYVKFFTIAGIVVFLIAIGKATFFFRIVYTIIPGFKFMRAPNLIFFLFSFSFIVLAAKSIDHLFVGPLTEQLSSPDPRARRRVIMIVGVMCALLVIIGCICTLGQDSIMRAMQTSLRPKLLAEWGPQVVDAKMKALEANFSSFVSGIWRSIVFVLGVLIVLFLALNRRFAAWILASIMIIGVMVDQVPLMAKFLPGTSGPGEYYRADDIVNVLHKDKTGYRVFPTPLYGHAQDCYLLYHDIQSTGGYIPNPLRRYQEFIGAENTVMYRPFNLVPMSGEPVNSFDAYYKHVDMLNCKYIIGPTLPEDLTRVPPQYHALVQNLMNYFARFITVLKGQQNSLFLNEHALPRAYLVGDYTVMEGSKILEYIRAPGFDPRRRVILEKDPGFAHPAEPPPLINAEITKYKANQVACMVDAPYDGIVVLVDNWHPDWKVFVDGEERECLQANYIFRGVAITRGEHNITFMYRSKAFDLGKIITIIVLCLTIALCAVLVVRTRKPLHSN